MQCGDEEKRREENGKSWIVEMKSRES